MLVASLFILPLSCAALVVPRGPHRAHRRQISDNTVASIQAKVIDLHKALPSLTTSAVSLPKETWAADYSNRRYNYPTVSLAPVTPALTIKSDAYDKLTRLLPRIMTNAVAITDKSWELGALVQALLEVYNPELTSFGYDSPSFNTSIPLAAMQVALSSLYGTDFSGAPSESQTRGDISRFLDWSSPTQLRARPLVGGDGALGDPAAIGPSTYLLAQMAGREDVRKALSMRSKEDYAWAVGNQLAYLNNGIKSDNGTISQREGHFELWADMGYMIPPLPACE